MVRYHNDELFSGRQKENTGEIGMVVREEVHCDHARIRRARLIYSSEHLPKPVRT